MNNKFPLFMLFLTLAFFGCRKELEPASVNPPPVTGDPQTEEHKVLVDNLTAVTGIFKELYKTKENVKLVYAAIFSGSYTDESVLFADLIYPRGSHLASSSRFQKLCTRWGVSHERFAGNFWAIANRTRDTGFSQFLTSLNRLSPAAKSTPEKVPTEVSIYFPYSENFGNSLEDDGTSEDLDLGGGEEGVYGPIATLVTATEDADEALGSLPYYVNGELVRFVQVLVNDDYAEANPTHIIGVNGIDPYDVPATTHEAFPPEDQIHVGLPREVKQVFIGDVRCIHQYDSFISLTGNGGGSEIRFTRSDGYLKVAGGQVTADNFLSPERPPIGRNTIKKHHFTHYGILWDDDWEADNKEQYFAIFEEDNRNTKELSAQITSSMRIEDLGVTLGPMAVKLSYESDDWIIKQQSFDRDVFFEMNRVNQENMVYDGWPVRDKNALVSYTLHDRTYY